MLAFGPRGLLCLLSALLSASATGVSAQTAIGVPAQTAIGVPATPGMPRDYRGVSVHIGGIYVTPVPNAPFTATVQIVSHQKLEDGTEHIQTTRNQIARTSAGQIYNERRRLVSPEFQGEPALLEVHTYDPATRQSVFLTPFTRVAREMTLPSPPQAPAALPSVPHAAPPGTLQGKVLGPTPVETPLGTRTLDGVELVGFERTRTLSAATSGTGQPLTITDEYWYAPALSIYCLSRHVDPRTGEQLVAVTGITRGEPSPDLFRIPDDYKIVDETPLPRPAHTQTSIVPAR